MMNSVIDFFSRNGYVLEVLITVSVFTFYFERRSLHPLRAATAIAVLFAYSIVWNLIPDEIRRSVLFVKYLGFSAVVYGCVLFCRKVSPWQALFATVGQITAQHLGFCLDMIILSLTDTQSNTLFAGLTDLVAFLFVCSILFVLFSPLLKNAKQEQFDNKKNIVLASGVLLFVVILHAVEEPFIYMYTDKKQFVISTLYRVVCCVFSFFLQYDILHVVKITDNYKVLEKVVALQKEQYGKLAEVSEQLRFQSHEMKYRMAQMENKVDDRYISELSSLVRSYENTVYSDNELLDVFLTQKKAQCEKKDIRLDCILDGKSLEFMDPSDMYALFGNAVDNAMEAVLKVKDKEKRIIALFVRKKMNQISIHIENYCEGEVLFEKGLPVTTKGNPDFHGFGLKSICMIVERYGGNVTISCENNVFNLNILIPQPE